MEFGICGWSWNRSFADTTRHLSSWGGQSSMRVLDCTGCLTVLQTSVLFKGYLYCGRPWTVENPLVLRRNHARGHVGLHPHTVYCTQLHTVGVENSPTKTEKPMATLLPFIIIFGMTSKKKNLSSIHGFLLYCPPKICGLLYKMKMPVISYLNL